MPTKLRFDPAATAAAYPAVYLLGMKADVLALLEGGKEPVGKFLTESERRTVISLAKATSVGAHGGGAASAAIGADETFKQVHLLFIPEVASRHNSPLRPDVVSALARRQIREDVPSALLIAAIPSGADEAAAVLSLGSSVARTLPTYTRKGNQHETASVLTLDIVFVRAADGSAVTDEAALKRVQYAAEGMRQAAALVDAPCNEINTATFAKTALETVHGLPHVTASEIVGEDLRHRGLGGIYGVGRAAEHPPRLIVLEYRPPTPGKKKTVAWCGKGIVFDTGGLCIKDRLSMLGMKRDMGGAAAMLGAFKAAVQSGFKDNLVCLLAVAENAVGRLATRPDDIHVLFSGKTVEINNTDAEGRLVLGDAVAYAAREYQPDVIVDMATLTGAQGIATGKHFAAIVCSDEEFEAATVKAGRASGELVHPLMYAPELFMHEFHSALADMKNSVADRANGQVSCAGLFIHSHLPSGYTDKNVWLHIDMATNVHVGERATGWGVALLLQLFC